MTSQPIDCLTCLFVICRFHVFAAHQLCEEELLDFDPKINDENLTKCLQTLKQYYTDLRQTVWLCVCVLGDFV